MNETLTVVSMLVAGSGLGLIFFGGLWWTIRRGVSSTQPALWFSGSLILRTGIVMTGFYFACGGDYERLLLCLLGLIMAGLAVMWFTRQPGKSHIHPDQESSHAH